jgi:fibronectin-binding autotransporter adhesin
VDGSGANAGTGNNAIYATGTIAVDGSLTVSRPAGGTGHTTFSSVLAGNGTLVVGNANGGTAPSASAIGRAFFSNAANTFNGTVQVVNGGNFLNGTINPSYDAVDVAAGSYLTLLSGGDATAVIGSLTGAGTFTKNSNTAIVTLTVGEGNFSGVIAQNLLSGTGTVALRKSGSGTLTLSGANTYTGVTTIDGGALVLGGTGKLGNGTYAAAIANNGALVCGSSANQTLRGIVSGAGSLLKTGVGTLTLTGLNTYGGDTVVSNGVVVVSGAGRLGTSQSVVVKNGASLDLQVGWALDDQARLNVENGGHVNLTDGVNETVSELYLGGRLMYQGTWGSSASQALNKDDTYFTGAGVVTMSALGLPKAGILIVR